MLYAFFSEAQKYVKRLAQNQITSEREDLNARNLPLGPMLLDTAYGRQIEVYRFVILEFREEAGLERKNTKKIIFNLYQ